MPPRRQNTSRRSPAAPLTTSSGLGSVRTSIRGLFLGRSSIGNRAPSPESPKTPRPTIGPQNLPSTRLVIPYLSRSASDRSTRSAQRSLRNPELPLSSRPITRNSLRHQFEQPNISTIQPRGRHNSTRRYGVDPAEQHLAQLAQDGRRRRRAKPKRRESRRCAPKIKNRKIRSKILSCFISGMILTLILTIYLALALSNKNESQEFHVLLILIILITTIFFCHSLIRLCMMIIHPPSEEGDLEQQLPSMIGPGGYANPQQPIRIALARDEEAAGIESEATKFPPPAYGLWRESVRVDPNRIFWQRNAALEQHISNPTERPTTANRPPSYISEDGIDYVVEAQPRSIAPTTDVPLPVHPSERGRVWQGP